VHHKILHAGFFLGFLWPKDIVCYIFPLVNIPTTPVNPNAILKEIASIQQMERGHVSVTRQTPEGPLYNHQTWEDGKNISRYLPRGQVPAVQEAIAGYQRFKQLTEAYARQIILKTREERAASVKKTPRPKSSSPKTPKSSN
jgi:hypothetical protein